MYLYVIPFVYLFLHLLFFLNLDWWLDHGFAGYHGRKGWKRLLAATVAGLTLPALLGCFLPDSGFKFAMAAAGNIWLGFFLYFGGCGFLLSFFAVAAGLMRKKRTARTRTVSRVFLCVSAALAVALNVYGLRHARDVKVHELTVEVDKPLDAADGADSLRVVLIADLHMSVNSRPETIRRMVELVNQQDADLVLAAGDYLTSTYRGLKDPETYAAILREMRARYGVYAVYGNHDVEEPLLGGFPMTPKSKAFRSEEVVSFIASCGFEVLSDEVADAVGGSIVLVGREDGEKTGRGTEKRAEAADLMAGIDTSKPVLVVEHEPVEFDSLAKAGADLVLSGHTHAGQIFPGNLITSFFNQNNYGLKTLSGVQSVVTSGVGYYGPPLRIGTDSEIMVVTIRFR